MLGFLGWLIIGVLAGLLARAVVPGRQPMGWTLTMLLGLSGSIVGGLISAAIFGNDPMNPGFHVSGLIMSTVGAAIVLGGYLAFARHTAA